MDYASPVLDSVRRGLRIEMDVAAVGAYVRQHPGLLNAVSKACRLARREFSTSAELQLVVYRDPEIHDPHLVLYVRLLHYREDIMRRIYSVSDQLEDDLASSTGLLCVTTDFRQPKPRVSERTLFLLWHFVCLPLYVLVGWLLFLCLRHVEPVWVRAVMGGFTGVAQLVGGFVVLDMLHRWARLP